MDNLADSVRKISFFSGFSREDLSRIAGKPEEETLAAGQIVFSQGENEGAVYVAQASAGDNFDLANSTGTGGSSWKI